MSCERNIAAAISIAIFVSSWWWVFLVVLSLDLIDGRRLLSLLLLLVLLNWDLTIFTFSVRSCDGFRLFLRWSTHVSLSFSPVIGRTILPLICKSCYINLIRSWIVQYRGWLSLMRRWNNDLISLGILRSSEAVDLTKKFWLGSIKALHHDSPSHFAPFFVSMEIIFCFLATLLHGLVSAFEVVKLCFDPNPALVCSLVASSSS